MILIIPLIWIICGIVSLMQWHVLAINYLFQGTNLMSLLDDVVTAVAATNAKITTLSGVIDQIDTTLDAVAQNIQNLINAGGGTPQQLQSILDAVNTANTAIDTAKTHADAVESEASGLTGTP